MCIGCGNPCTTTSDISFGKKDMSDAEGRTLKQFSTTVPEREEMTSAKKGVNIEPYLRAEMEKGSFDFRLVPRIGADGRVYIYIHPFGRDGETMDYEASDDQLFLRY